MKGIRIGFIALALAVAVASCGTTSVPQATQAYCAALATFEQSVASLNALGPGATVGQVKDAHKAVEQSFQAVSAAAANVQGAKVDDLSAAVNNLQKTVNSVPDSATINEAMTAVKPQVAVVQAASAQLRSAMRCA